MKKSHLLLCLLLLVSTTACSTLSQEESGTVTGAVLGGLLGSRFGHHSGKMAAIAGGTLIGAYLGSNIGRTMDELDRQNMQTALESGRVTRWQNRDTGRHYVVKPRRVYHSHRRVCREFTTLVMMDGKAREVRGTACRTPSQKWEIRS